MARDNHTARDELQRVWATNVTPLVIAARAGASEATQTASRERARARRQQRWWQQRWVMVTGAGLAVVGAAGSTYALLTRQRAAGAPGTGKPGAPATGQQPASGRSTSGQSGSGIRSTMETGREKVAGAARTMMDKVRGGDTTGAGQGSGSGQDTGSGQGTGSRAAPADRPASAPSGSPGSRDQVPTVGSGYSRPL